MLPKQARRWPPSLRRVGSSDPAIFFTRYRDPLLTFTGAITLAAVCAVGGLLWGSAHRPQPGIVTVVRQWNPPRQAHSALADVDTSSVALAALASARTGRPDFTTVLVDGRLLTIGSTDSNARRLLQRAGISISPADQVLTRSAPRHVSTGLEAPSAFRFNGDVQERTTTESSITSRGDRIASRTNRGRVGQTVDVEVRRAVPLILHENTLQTSILTTQSTVGDSLQAAGVQLHKGDQVTPSLDTPVSPGLQVFLRRSVPLTLDVGGAVHETRSLAATVGEALAEHGVTLGLDDSVQPQLDHPLEPDMRITVTRVERQTIEEQENLDFGVQRRPDPNLEIGQQRVEPGHEGILHRQVVIVRENGQEVSRNVTRQWIDPQPQDGVLYYGTKLVVRDLQSPEGDLQYVRTMQVYTTWYDASDGDKPRSSPWYGITATGMRAGRGVVAVDPSVIPLYTRMYIPGYGLAVAGDVGGAVRGHHIDLGFEEGQVSPWRSGWVTIYILK